MTQNTGNKNIHFEIKSQLAKLLATEDITVQHNTGVSTAMFDVKSRTLTLPVWENISEDLYDMLVVHEVGHALDTPTDGWKNAIDNIANKHHDNNPSDSAKSAIKDFLNIVEDARIDKRQKRRYPGSKRNYIAGYKELNDRNFFGINGKEIASLPFIDRINLYFKTIGLHINFTPEEKTFVHRISNAETFDEVVQITDDVYAYAKQKKEEQKSKTSIDDVDASDEDQQEDAFDFDDEEENNNNNDLNSFDGDDNDDDEESEYENEDGDASDDADEEGEEIEAESEQKQTSSGAGNDDDENVPESITEQAARSSMSTIVSNDNVNYIYCQLPKFKLENIVDDYTVVMEDIKKSIASSYPFYNTYHKDSSLQAFQAWKRKENETISFMVKEFEMKKAADFHSRISIAKTGTLDTNKLHSYKYNEDIFRKLAVLPQGKNHGFVMLLDWSGSMSDCIEHTIKQLMSLTMFCKRVQIPFEVYLFRNAYGDEHENIRRKGGQYDKFNGVVQFDAFKLRNILSSRMNVATLNKAYEYLWHMSFYHVRCDHMDSTPLNQSIIAIEEIVKNFQRKNKLQIVNTIILTDGASDPAGYVYFDDAARQEAYKDNSKRHVYVLRDEKTKKSYVTNLRWNESTSIYLKILKERTGTNLIGFFLHNGNIKQLSYVADYNWLTSESVQQEWKENKFLTLSNQGYDEYYILNFNRKFLPSATNTLEVDSRMTKFKIAREFIKFNEKKTINRVLLSRFISRVSATHV